MTTKRNDVFSVISVKLCPACLREHSKQYFIRYPAPASGEEVCECPCQCKRTGAPELPAAGMPKRKYQRKPGARVRPAKPGDVRQESFFTDESNN